MLGRIESIDEKAPQFVSYFNYELKNLFSVFQNISLTSTPGYELVYTKPKTNYDDIINLNEVNNK